MDDLTLWTLDRLTALDASVTALKETAAARGSTLQAHGAWLRELHQTSKEHAESIDQIDERLDSIERSLTLARGIWEKWHWAIIGIFLAPAALLLYLQPDIVEVLVKIIIGDWGHAE